MSTARSHSPARPENGTIKGVERSEPSVARRPEDAREDDVIRCMRDDGTLDPAHDPKLSKDEVASLYRAMVRTRLLDDRLVTLQRQGRIGFHIGSLGEE